MKKLIGVKMIAVFLILAFLISWLAWFLMPANYGDLVMFVPGVLAIALTIYKREKLKTLLKMTGIYNLMLGLLLPLIAFALYLLIVSSTGIQTFGLPEVAIAYNNGDLFLAWIRFLTFGLPYMLGINLLFACGEEIGWRGYLLKTVKPKIPNFWFRGLIVGIIWGTWHLPIYFLAGGSFLNLLIFLMNVCILSICYTCIYEYRNSVWPTVLAHGLHNSFFNSVLPIITLTSSGNDLFLGEEGLIVTICYATIILITVFLSKLNIRGAAFA